MSRTKSDSALTARRQKEQKMMMIEQLQKIPIVQIACEKIGVSRATYYRWLDDDQTFAAQTQEAILVGTNFINDMAEGALIAAIKDQNFPAISFWLRHRHKAFADKLQVEAVVTAKPPELSAEDASLVADALHRLGERRQEIINDQTYAKTSEQQLDGHNDHAHANESNSAKGSSKEES